MPEPHAQPSPPAIFAVIPCYRETAHIMDVLASFGPEVSRIYVCDDACPDGTGDLVERDCTDHRVRVLRNPRNTGVGGATLLGYRAAIADGADIIVKVDGDGQMDPKLIPNLVQPIAEGRADYTKGNRLHRRDAVQGMPALRLFGNMALTLLTKLSSGYWQIMDPTNGFTAIHAAVARELPLDDIANGFFFETDMLFRLAGLDAVVVDVPMRAKYGAEQSHLEIHRILFEFLGGHIRNGFRRIVDTYFLRDVGLASIELVFGSLLLIFGVLYGGFHWWRSIVHDIYASAGTAMLSALSVIVGVQLLVAFFSQDIRRVPETPVHPRLRDSAETGEGSDD